MSTELAACEYEDSTNCIWNAQEQGNGIGQSFADIDGSGSHSNIQMTGTGSLFPTQLKTHSD